MCGGPGCDAVFVGVWWVVLHRYVREFVWKCVKYGICACMCGVGVHVGHRA